MSVSIAKNLAAGLFQAKKTAGAHKDTGRPTKGLFIRGGY